MEDTTAAMFNTAAIKFVQRFIFYFKILQRKIIVIETSLKRASCNRKPWVSSMDPTLALNIAFSSSAFFLS